MMQYYDYESVARQASLNPDEVDRLRRAVREDYPNDDMLFELHMLRACRAIAEGRVKLVEILDSRGSMKR